MTKIEDVLKAAIVQMPVKEKDKLLLRLIAKDTKLVNRLIFELLEDGASLDERALALRKKILQELPGADAKYLTPGLLMMELRYLSGRITEHVDATKDKVGEVTLTILMFVEAFRRHLPMLNGHPPKRSDKLAIYMCRRMVTILKKAEKLDEDYHLEFRKDLNELLSFLWSFKPTAEFAEKFNLPRKFT
jgi:hypothetical protein